MQKLLFALLTLVSYQCFAATYLCTEKEEVGFSYNESTESWKHARFPGNQFLLKPLESEDKTDGEKYGVYETKGGNLLFRCQYWFPKSGVAHCGNGNDYHFKFGRTSEAKGKFIFSDLGLGYLRGYPSAAPRVGIGQCIKI